MGEPKGETWASGSTGLEVAGARLARAPILWKQVAILISSVASLDLVSFRAGTCGKWKHLVPRCIAAIVWISPDTVLASSLDKQGSGVLYQKKIACPYDLHLAVS